MNPPLHVEMPLAKIGIEAERLDGNQDFRAPSRAGPLRRGVPDAVPVGIVVAAGLDEPVVARAGRIDGKDVTGPAVEKRAEHDADVILVVETGIAAHAETDDVVRILVADDADGDRRRTRKDPHRGPRGGRLAFVRIGLRERVDELGARPHRLVEHAVDVQIAGDRAGANARRLLRKRGRCQRDPGNQRQDRAPHYFQVTSMPKKCMKTWRFGLFFGFCCGLRM